LHKVAMVGGVVVLVLLTAKFAVFSWVA
jgi:hypothetical protein